MTLHDVPRKDLNLYLPLYMGGLLVAEDVECKVLVALEGEAPVVEEIRVTGMNAIEPDRFQTKRLCGESVRSIQDRALWASLFDAAMDHDDVQCAFDEDARIERHHQRAFTHWMRASA